MCISISLFFFLFREFVVQTFQKWMALSIIARTHCVDFEQEFVSHCPATKNLGKYLLDLTGYLCLHHRGWLTSRIISTGLQHRCGGTEPRCYHLAPAHLHWDQLQPVLTANCLIWEQNPPGNRMARGLNNYDKCWGLILEMWATSTFLCEPITVHLSSCVPSDVHGLTYILVSGLAVSACSHSLAMGNGKT